MWLAVAGLLLVFALVQLVLAVRVAQNVPRIDELAPSPPLATWPVISVVVPARDEAARIEGALASKLSCGYPALEVVAIDDRSRDATGAILDRLAAQDPRLRVAHVRELPVGWLGKLNAMAHGLAQATGEWVLLSDADVHVEPGTLERLIAHGEAERIDLLAVFPRLDRVRLFVDAASAGLMRVLALAGRTWAANDDASRIGVGVGAFMLVRRRWLIETDALGELRMEIADDVALGALLKHRGARTRFLAGADRVHLVFLDSLRAMAASADKGGGALGFGWARPLGAAIAPLLIDLALPFAILLLGAPLERALAAAALVALTLVHVVLAVRFALPLAGALAWPIAAPVLAVLTARAGLKAWRDQGVYWRDTFYPRALLEAGRRLDLASMRIR